MSGISFGSAWDAQEAAMKDPNAGLFRKNFLTNALLQTMDIVSTNVVESSTAKTLTLEAKIIDIIDEGRGIYKVKYLDNRLEAYSSNEAIKYKIDDIVYIIVPEGNFDKRITILSSASVDTSKSVLVEGPLRIPIGDSLYGSLFDINLCSFREEEFSINGNKSFFAKTFSNYLKDNRNFSLSCYIETNIDANRRSGGNYGLRLTIPVVDVNGVSSSFNVDLDVNNILGDAYNFNAPALQNLYFTIPEDQFFDEKNFNNLSLTAFVNGFPSQHPKLSDGSYDEINYPRDEYIDIWITKIGIYPIKVVSLDEKQGYFLKLRATEGSLFWDAGASSKELYPDLYLNGSPTSAAPFECYWFRENYRIGVNSDAYYRYGGIGWEILNDREKIEDTDSGQATYKYTTNNYRFPVSINEIHSDLKYKCVLVKDDIILTDTIVLRNIVDPAVLTLTTSSGSNVYTRGVGDVTLIVRYHDKDISDDGNMKYEWKRFNKYNELITGDGPEIFKLIGEANGRLEMDGVDYLETRVSIPVKNIFDSNTIVCTAYKTKNEEGELRDDIIGTVSINIITQDAPSYKVVLENADRVFKYDSDGDSPMSADYDGPISSKVNAITPILARTYKDTGEEFTEDEYNISTITWKIPKNSMITIEDIDLREKIQDIEDDRYYIIQGDYIDYKSLTYSIGVRYDKSKSDNTIKVNVTMKDKSVDGMSTIKFLKDGESGTNGSKFTAIITHGNSNAENNQGRAYEELNDEGQICKLQLVYVESGDKTARPEWYLFNNGVGTGRQKLIKFTENFNNNQQNRENWTTFDVKMYCDGVPIDETIPGGVDLSYEWNIFDYQNQNQGNIMCPITIESIGDQGVISIKTENVEGNNPYSGVIRWPNDMICCATLEVKCRAIKSNIDAAGSSDDKKMFEEYIYAYYPIECTYSKTADILGPEEDGDLVPRLDGGFSNVIYSNDGKNPQFDTTSNFTFVDNIPKEAEDVNKDYTWYVSDSLLIEDVPSDDNDGSIKKLEKKITPSTTRYPDGTNNQYVKVNFGYDIDTKSLQDKINNLIYAQPNGRNYDFAYLQVLRTIQENLHTISDFVELRDSILSNINSKDTLIKEKMDLYNILTEGISIVENIIGTYGDIFTTGYIDYLKKLVTGNNNVFGSRLTNAVDNLETNSFSTFQSIFNRYGALKDLEMTPDPEGVLIDTTIEMFITGANEKRKAKALNAIADYNSKFATTKYGAYLSKILDDDPDNVYQQVKNITSSVKDMLLNYIEDDSTPTESWDCLIKQNYDIEIPSEYDPEEEGHIIIENPYYNRFNPAYFNIKQAIYNMNADQLKSYDDINKIVNFIDNELSQYYELDLSDKINVVTTALNVIQSYINNLTKRLDLHDISDLMHIKPIIMLLNRYELSNINGWDGNKLVVDEEQGYVLAPQLGAGMKENGLFTGVIMGVYRLQKSGAAAQQKIGLFGWAAGEESIFLNAKTGAATFGTARQGKIMIDPGANNLRIVDSLYTAHEEDPSKPLAGMCISFTGDRTNITPERPNGSGGYIHFGDSAGKIYSGVHDDVDSNDTGFYLSHDGFSIGKNVHIYQNGNFIFGNVNKEGNKYIEWKGSDFVIGDGVLLSANNIKAGTEISCGPSKLDSNGNFNVGDHFQVKTNGTVYIAGNATIKGTMQCAAGSWIGNWFIRDTVGDQKNNGALYGYTYQGNVGGSIPDEGFSTIRLIPNKAVIGFTSGSTLGSGNDYSYIGGTIPGTSDRCKQNFICIYPNLKNDVTNYGYLRARGLYSDFGLLGNDGLYIGCHSDNGKKMKQGKVTEEGAIDTTHGLPIKITKAAIYRYNTSKKNWDKIFNFITAPVVP